MMDNNQNCFCRDFPKISIIVPVYNCEQYLTKCVESLFRQTFKKFEVLLIDDGSTDNSGILCDNLAKNKDNVFAFHKINGGASSARNYGVIKSKAEWISFVDSDDTVADDYLETLIKGVIDRKCDISLGNYSLDSNREKHEADSAQSNFVIYQQSCLKELFLKRQINIVITSLLMKREDFYNKDLWLDETVKFGEDAIFYWKLIFSYDKFAYSYKPIYFYNVRENSVTTSPSIQKIKSNYDAFVSLYNYLEPKCGGSFSNFIISRQVFSLIRICAVYSPYRDYLTVFNFIDFKKFKKYLVRFPDKRIRLLTVMLSISKRFFYVLNRLRGK